MQPIIETKILYSRQEIVSRDSNVVIPNEPGVCTFYFKEIPGDTPTIKCKTKGGLTSLFISETGKLRRRIKTEHLKGKTDRSVLRVGLAALLYAQGKLHYSIYRKGKDDILHSEGEKWLNNWMDENAFVCWQLHDNPLALKKEMLKDHSFPLNTQHNSDNPFCYQMKQLIEEVRVST